MARVLTRFKTSQDWPLALRTGRRSLHPDPAWTARIGVELHVRLARTTKLFSPSNVDPADPSNIALAAFDASLPGAQPNLAFEAVGLALQASLALGCRPAARCRFDRKHYTYPDLPSGYQITQHFSAFAADGLVKLSAYEGSKDTVDVRIKQIQLEQDTAKSVADPLDEGSALVDLNRSGMGLLEIVTEPDMSTPEQVVAFVRRARALLRHVGVSDGNMEEGSLRCDLNVSVRSQNGGETSRCEIKNVNGFGNIEAAIRSETARHVQLLKRGTQTPKETRGFDMRRGETFRLRTKETAPEYRYMPDPDLPPLQIPPELLQEMAPLLAQDLDATLTRLTNAHGLAPKDAHILCSLGDGTDHLEEVGSGVRYFDAAVAAAHQASDKAVADWMIHHLLASLKKARRGWSDLTLAPQDLTKLADAVAAGAVNRATAKTMLDEIVSAGSDGLDQLTDAARASSVELEYGDLARSIIRDMPDEAATFRGGRTGVVMRLVGEGMRRSGRRADAQELRRALEACLTRD